MPDKEPGTPFRSAMSREKDLEETEVDVPAIQPQKKHFISNIALLKECLLL
jgi:hypothetical protein